MVKFKKNLMIEKLNNHSTQHRLVKLRYQMYRFQLKPIVIIARD